MINDGIYLAFFTGSSGAGASVLTLKHGKIAGADAAGAKITGDYKVENDILRANAEYEFIHNGMLATSGQMVPKGFRFPVTFEASLKGFQTGYVRAVTPQGVANVSFKFVTEAI